eukprot:m.25791 g.25791  ORF g.25791 m.25791 type:complete len:555 (-) comp9208_c0_seq1:140-1804(-)
MLSGDEDQQQLLPDELSDVNATVSDNDGDGYDDIAPLGRKIAFAVGAFGSMSTHTAVGFFLAPFLLEVAGVTPYLVSICTLFGRVWDAVTDPAVGLLVAKTRTRWGCLKPWIAGATIPGALSFFAIFVVVDAPLASKGAYYIFMYLIYQMVFSCYQVPYTSLTMHISKNPKQRDQATAIRMIVETIALLCGSVVISFVVNAFAATEGPGTCRPCDTDDDDLSLDVSTGFTEHHYDQGQANGYLVGMGVVAAISVICGFVVSFFVPEMKNMYPPIPEGTLKSLKEIKNNKTYIILTTMFMWAWMANNVNQANNLLWLKYGFRRDQEFQYFLLTFICTTTCMLPVWLKLMAKYGKPRCFAVGLCIQLPYALVQLFLPEDTPSYLLHIGVASSSIGVGAVYLIPWAMLPDVIDEAELLKGERKDSVYYSFFVFFQKFGSGIAISLSTLALQFANFKSSLCCGEEQPPAVRQTLMYLSTVVPICLVLLSLFFTRFYTLGNERVKEIKHLLGIKRAKKKHAAPKRMGVEEQGRTLLDEEENENTDEVDYDSDGTEVTKV